MTSVSKMIAGLSLILAAGVGLAATQTQDMCEGFVPKNNMKIPVGYKAPIGWKSRVSSRFSTDLGTPAPSGGLTQDQFNATIDHLLAIYGDEVKQLGGNLEVNRLWDDETVNASAERSGSTWTLNMYGGLARHPEITPEGFALVICHETGHHLGGAPKIKGWFGSSDWATNEGGADYFATLKCLRRFFADDDNKTIIANSNLDQFAKDQCTAQFSNEKDQLLCMRSALAGQSVAGLFMDLRSEKNRPAFNTPDLTQVKKMDDNHPATQCRMDTYFAGATCHVDVAVHNDEKDAAVGACVQGVDAIGFRPRCWYKPSKTEGSAVPAPTSPAPAPSTPPSNPQTGNDGSGNDDDNGGNNVRTIFY